MTIRRDFDVENTSVYINDAILTLITRLKVLYLLQFPVGGFVGLGVFVDPVKNNFLIL